MSQRRQGYVRVNVEEVADAVILRLTTAASRGKSFRLTGKECKA